MKERKPLNISAIIDSVQKEKINKNINIEDEEKTIKEVVVNSDTVLDKVDNLNNNNSDMIDFYDFDFDIEKNFKTNETTETHKPVQENKNVELEQKTRKQYGPPPVYTNNINYQTQYMSPSDMYKQHMLNMSSPVLNMPDFSQLTVSEKIEKKFHPPTWHHNPTLRFHALYLDAE